MRAKAQPGLRLAKAHPSNELASTSMTPTEAAEFLGVSVGWLRSRAQAGAVPVHLAEGRHKYHFFEDELEAWLRSGE